MKTNRREFIKKATVLTGATALVHSVPSFLYAGWEGKGFDFKISLAQWSLHKAFFSKKIDVLDFPVVAKNDYGVDAVEYVNQFFKDKAKDNEFLKELKKRAGDHGVKSQLIMIDQEGPLASPDDAKRNEAVENHYKWVEAAKFLGCHSIRVNLQGADVADAWKKAAVQGLGKLAEFGSKHDINVIVENHGSFSSNGKLLAEVIKEVNNKRCGTLPDFGNFKISETESYDRYQGVKELLPFAKGVSAKTFDFDAQGNETTIDYVKMLKLVKASGYRGYIGIEYEGDRMPEEEGIRATKKLLEKVRAELS